ncbi:MAG TPA: YfaZ family outer membrane protein [Gammaproteobacteria bacterium]|nr:YfaZ family outer membrane protein [Gammaproteobacteria bacterium]
MRVRLLFAGLLAGLACTAAQAQTLGLNLNNNAARVLYTAPLQSGQVGGVKMGASYLHRRDRGDAVTLGLQVTGDAGARNVPITAGVGGRFYWVNRAHSSLSATALAVGGHVTVTPPRQNRLGFTLAADYAPRVLAFSDAEHLLEWSARAEYQVLRQATAYLGYRQIKVGYRHAGTYTLDSGLMVGLKLLF